ncbi:MAG: DUF1385 domain-containing protein [Firmicutes bacterium]|nr:DUF1385 domain-containing protein [Bacillota bacterium]
MMRGRRHYAVAVRRGPGDVVLQSRELTPYTEKHPLLKRPFIRGIIALGEAFLLGLKALEFSANQLMEAEGEEEITTREMVVAVILALGMTVLLFIALPLFIRQVIGSYLPGLFWRNLSEGLVRALILMGYILAVSVVKDIQRVFAYHGAEHQVIHTYEAGEELTVENARKKSPLHPRCGTSFLLFVVIISAVLFSFLGEQTLVMRFLSRLLLLPVIAGISYEIIKLSGKNQSFFLWRWLSWPGLLLQRLTTRTPDDEQLQVAIMALQEVLNQEGEMEVQPLLSRAGARSTTGNIKSEVDSGV